MARGRRLIGGRRRFLCGALLLRPPTQRRGCGLTLEVGRSGIGSPIGLGLVGLGLGGLGLGGLGLGRGLAGDRSQHAKRQDTHSCSRSDGSLHCLPPQLDSKDPKRSRCAQVAALVGAGFHPIGGAQPLPAGARRLGGDLAFQPLAHRGGRKDGIRLALGRARSSSSCRRSRSSCARVGRISGVGRGAELRAGAGGTPRRGDGDLDCASRAMMNCASRRLHEPAGHPIGLGRAVRRCLLHLSANDHGGIKPKPCGPEGEASLATSFHGPAVPWRPPRRRATQS